MDVGLVTSQPRVFTSMISALKSSAKDSTLLPTMPKVCEPSQDYPPGKTVGPGSLRNLEHSIGDSRGVVNAEHRTGTRSACFTE